MSILPCPKKLDWVYDYTDCFIKQVAGEICYNLFTVIARYIPSPNQKMNVNI